MKKLSLMKSKNFVIYGRKNLLLIKKIRKVGDYCHCTGKFRGTAHSICNLRDKIQREIPIVFHFGWTYDYHFMIKQLAEEFKVKFVCLEETTEKYITFSAPAFKRNHDD